jgi:hypothetical protein
LLTRCDNNQRCIRGVVDTIIDINAIGIDGDWNERQSREFQTVPGEGKARVFHPNLLSLKTEHTKRQP